ncbi:MAG: amidohydrolase family protein [Gemmatimonadota bacterium]|nr:amidohydrolase family protein [Gemmatimonadota bacterium]
MIVATRRAIQFLPPLVAIAIASPAAAQVDRWRTITFETTEVSAPDVAVSPDGHWLIFSMLGKLFRLPVKGGDAEQLTLGPYYDIDPAISPDGKLVAFQSDRDGSAGNIFLLNMASREITQLTHEVWADRPAWAPDGQTVVYLRLERKAWNPLDTMSRPPAVVRRIRLTGGEPETLRELGPVWSVFHLPDGRVGWAIVQRDSTSRRMSSRIEVRGIDGKVSTLRLFDGIADPVVPSPKADGLYARYAQWDTPPQEPYLLFAPLSEGAERRIAPVSGVVVYMGAAGFAVSPDNASLYLGNLGHLWKVALRGGQREAVPFRARVTLAIREPTEPPKWMAVAPGNSGKFRTIQQPRLSPDGSQIVFGALARLWRQSLKGGQARRLVEGDGTESDPAFSPDGRRIGFVSRAPGKWEIKVLDLQSGQIGTVGPHADCGYHQLTWSLHGELIAATSCDHQVLAIDPRTGSVRVLAKTSEEWEPYPQLSADGKTLYFQAEFPGSKPAFYRLQLEAAAKPEPLLSAIGNGMNISTRGQWVAHTVPNGVGIRLATVGPGGIAQPDVRSISAADGSEFSFTPDGSALLFVAGNTLWREPLTGGTRREIPIRMELRAPAPPPVLLQRIRVLDFAAGGFGAETSLLIDGGHIRWIGPEPDRAIPSGTVTVDAGGRFAIPGLFDMHGHGGGCGGAARIAYGVTSVRNMGGRLAGQNAHADRSDFTSDPVPRCFYPGRIFEGPQGRSRNEDQFFVNLFDEGDARTHVRLWKAQGAQFIKLYNMVPWPLQRAAADEARRVGLPVAAHGYTLEQAVKGVTLGYAGLTHWAGGFYDDALQMFAAAGTRWEPTMGQMAGFAVSFRNDPERFRRASRGDPQIGDNVLRGRWAEILRTMRAAYRRGVTFLPGTDAGPEGLALQWELEFYAEAGIPPLDVLRFATQASAQTVGAGDHLGTLEVGKLADLILLDANPLQDIKNTQTIWRVIKGGWMFDPKVLLPNPN